MTHDSAGGSTSVDAPKPGVEELQHEVEETRAELAETVEALSAKLDVKSRARDKVAATKQQALDRVAQAKAGATDERGRPTPVTLAVTAAVCAVLAGAVVVVWRQHR